MNYFRKNLIKVAIAIVFVLILVGASLSYYNRHIMSQSLATIAQTKLTEETLDRIEKNIRMMDIAGRGFALIRQPQYLFHTPKMAVDYNATTYRTLDSLFVIQGLDTMKSYHAMKKNLDNYTQIYSQMIEHLRQGNTDQYLAMLEKDYGKIFYIEYDPFNRQIREFEKNLSAEANDDYTAAVNRNTIVQFLLLLVGLPTVVLIFYRLERDARERKALFYNLEVNNRKYLFNDNQPIERLEGTEILDNSITSLQKAAKFVNQISAGNYSVQWEGLSQENLQYNQENLAGRLMVMRDEMKKVKDDDAKRIWATEGLSKFSEIVRKYQNNLDELTYQALTYLVKYTSSQQGSLFIHDANDENVLNLAACYAFERKKHLEKQVKVGEGLLGQTFLEAQTVVMKDLPRGYISITSGLGDAPPTCLVIVPFKHNETVQAIAEFASFREYQPHVVAFLEKAGEFVASAITAAQNNEKTGTMLDQMRLQTEQLKAQEEELRQNLEELEATQEEMRRKEVELERKLQTLQV
jgi:CHASE3 domain sensor protein